MKSVELDTFNKCQVDGCINPHLAKGFCRLHYRRWSVHGDPNIVLREHNSIQVDKNGDMLCCECQKSKPQEQFSFNNKLGRPTRNKCHSCQYLERKSKIRNQKLLKN